MTGGVLRDSGYELTNIATGTKRQAGASFLVIDLLRLRQYGLMKAKFSGLAQAHASMHDGPYGSRKTNFSKKSLISRQHCASKR
jgi:hypothetical protein